MICALGVGNPGVIGVLAGWDVWRNKADAIPAWWFAAAVIGAWGMVAVTAWHGGELVYRHGLGVMALPEAEAGHEEGYDHGAMPDGEKPAHANAKPEDNVHEYSKHEHAY